MPKISEYPEATKLDDNDQLLIESTGVYKRLAGANVNPRTSYRFEQESPSAAWVIDHNMGFRPAGIHVEDSAGTMHSPSIEHPNENRTILYFVGATTGFADLS